VKLRAVFVGISPARSKGIVSAIGAASDAELTAVHLKAPGTALRAATGEAFDAVFINCDLEESQLRTWIGASRKSDPKQPIILVYRSEPDGRAFSIASRYDCWLFGDEDRIGRTLSPAELGEALLRGAAERSIEHRLMEVSLSAGPCSTGS
jgi:hypothetical protein